MIIAKRLTLVNGAFCRFFCYNILMRYFRYIATTLIVTTLFGGYFYYLTFSGRIEANPVSSAMVAVLRPYPKLTSPKQVALNCDYHGKNLTVSETLYGSLYDYYKTDPAKKRAYLVSDPAGFVYTYAQDGTVKDLTSKIAALGKENGLSADQTLDLGTCFMQGIPYDDAKASLILGTNFSEQPMDKVIPRYPYETLYDNAGICTDKTYLGAAVLHELGYETAILTFDAQKHMSLGVAVPSGYGSLGTSYGIMELTGNGFLVGDMPELSPSAGLAINNFQTIPQGGTAVTLVKQVQLDRPNKVIPVSDGLIYNRVVERVVTRQKLEELKPQLTTLQAVYQQAQTVLTTSEAKLAQAEQTYRVTPNDTNYRAYTVTYNQYLADYNNAQAKVNEYNKMVNLYNSYVEKYSQF